MEGTGIQSHVDGRSCMECCALRCRHASVSERPSRVKQSEAMWQRQLSATGQGDASDQTAAAGIRQPLRCSELDRYQVALAHLHRLISAADAGHSSSIARRNPRLVSFLAGMLCLDPEKRFTPLQALVHPFFGEVFPFTVPMAAAKTVLKYSSSSTATGGFAGATPITTGRRASAGIAVPFPRGLPIPAMARGTGNVRVMQHSASTFSTLAHERTERRWVEGHDLLGRMHSGNPVTSPHPPMPVETSRCSSSTKVGSVCDEPVESHQNPDRGTPIHPSGFAIAPSSATQVGSTNIPTLNTTLLGSAVSSPAFSQRLSDRAGTLVASVCLHQSPYDKRGGQCGPHPLLHADDGQLTKEPKLQAKIGVSETTICTKNSVAGNATIATDVSSTRRNRSSSAANLATLAGFALANEDSALDAKTTLGPSNGKQTDPLESTGALRRKTSTEQIHDVPIPSPPVASSFIGKATRLDPRQRNRFLTPAVLANLNPDVAERFIATAAVGSVSRVTKEHWGQTTDKITRAKRSSRVACANEDLQGLKTGAAPAATPGQTRRVSQELRPGESNCLRERLYMGERINSDNKSAEERCGDGNVLWAPTATPHGLTTAGSNDNSKRRPKRPCVGEPIYSDTNPAKDEGSERWPKRPFNVNSTYSDAKAIKGCGAATIARSLTASRRAAIIAETTTRRVLDESESPQR